MLMVINSFVFALVTLCISYLIGISIKEKMLYKLYRQPLIRASIPWRNVRTTGNSRFCNYKVGSFYLHYWYVRANNTIGSLSNMVLKSKTHISVYGYSNRICRCVYCYDSGSG